MPWIILIVLVVIGMIGNAIGIGFWGVLGIILALGIILLVAFKLKPDKNDNTKKTKIKKTVSKSLFILIPIVLVIIIIATIVGVLDISSSSSADSEYDDAMASYDWGDDHYYDSSDNTVKKKAW